MHPNDVLRYGDATLRNAIDGLSSEAWATPVCGRWTARDVVAHLASYELLLGDVLLRVLGDEGDTPALDRLLSSEAFNDAEVEARADRTPEEVFAEYSAASERARDLAARVPEATWRAAGILEWYGADYDLEDFLTYASYGHKREHAAQLAAVAGGGGA